MVKICNIRGVCAFGWTWLLMVWLCSPKSRVETESDGTRWRTGGEVKGKEANGVGSQQFSAWLGTVHPVLLQLFSPDPHSKKASTRLNWHPRRYKWTRPFRGKTESGFCACAITSRFHSTHTRSAEYCNQRNEAAFLEPQPILEKYFNVWNVRENKHLPT